MHRACFKPGAAGALALLVAALATTPARAQGWGTVKGQVVWGLPKPPKPELIDVKGEIKCLKGGKLYSDKWIINPKNNGVKNAVVFLVDADNPGKALPVHADLKKLKKPQEEMDQPGCLFIPRILVMREGQSLLVKNSATFNHNVNIQGGAGRVSLNKILPPGTSLKVDAADMKAGLLPINVSCNIHGWMKNYIWVLNHPYAVLTDADGKFELKNAPAGKYKLVIWHEDAGWVVDGKSPEKAKGGKVLAIPKGGTVDAGTFKAKPDED